MDYLTEARRRSCAASAMRDASDANAAADWLDDLKEAAADRAALSTGLLAGEIEPPEVPISMVR